MAPRGVALFQYVLGNGLADWVVAGAILMFCTSAAAQLREATAEATPVWRVVLIRSWDSLYPANVVREAALRDALVDDAARIVEFFPEEIDTLRFPGAMDTDFWLPLQRKYRGTRIDLVIASGIGPLEFATRYRDAVWPGAALVFNGVFDGELDGWTRPPRTTGVTMELDVAGALALGRSLVPGARHVYVVSGSSEFDRTLHRLATAKITQPAGSKPARRRPRRRPPPLQPPPQPLATGALERRSETAAAPRPRTEARKTRCRPGRPAKRRGASIWRNASLMPTFARARER